MEIVDYSEKAIAVTGNTKPHKDALKRLGGKFNPYLKCGAGWIFSKKKTSEVESFIKTASSEVDPFDTAIEDALAERAGVGMSLSSYERGNY